jgi:hypothetical protein
MQAPSPGDVLVITGSHEPLPIPVRRKRTDPASLYRTTIALLPTAHPTQKTNVCAVRDVQVARSNELEASIRSQHYMTRVWVCQVRNNIYFCRDFPFDFIACAPARYMSCDTQVLHPIAIALAINFGLFPRQNPSFCRKIRHFTAFSANL